jgi:SapC
MQISPPFGYTEIIPFLKTQKVSLPKPGHLPEFAKTLNAVPVSYTEFNVAYREYPLVYSSGDGGKTFAPVAVLGLEANENLFLHGQSWEEGRYVPAYLRRYPFCMARVTLDNVEQAERLICVEKASLSDNGEALFDAEAKPSEAWVNIEKLLQEYEADLERTREMCGILADYGLLEPFTMQATLNAGGAMHLTGMFRVDERKLEFLNAAQHKNLIKKGIMGRIYTHLLSLDNFGRLLDVKATRPAAAAPAPAIAAEPETAPAAAKPAVEKPAEAKPAKK